MAIVFCSTVHFLFYKSSSFPWKSNSQLAHIVFASRLGEVSEEEEDMLDLALGLVDT